MPMYRVVSQSIGPSNFFYCLTSMKAKDGNGATGLGTFCYQLTDCTVLRHNCNIFHKQ